MNKFSVLLPISVAGVRDDWRVGDGPIRGQPVYRYESAPAMCCAMWPLFDKKRYLC